MDFTPHTPRDVARMLEHLDLSDISDLFSHLPEAVRPVAPLEIPAPLSEMEVMDHINELLDPEYQYADEGASDGVGGMDRFLNT